MASTLTLYIQNTFKLANTIVVKHSMLADAVNVEMTRLGYPVDPNDKTTWKYYMNLAGQYHQYDKDQLSNLSAGLGGQAKYQYMQVFIAGDNGPTQIDFTADLVSGPNADPATAAEYRYGQPFYNELVARYPTFETLILGIINPIDINIAINAYDGEILYCGDYFKAPMNDGTGRYYYQLKQQSVFDGTPLVESNEEHLIPALQQYIDAFVTRWINQDFLKIEDLYAPTVWGIMFPNMVPALMNVRQSGAFSSKAHSFHVSAHLESHGYLGSINQHLPLPVVMWMYRNVAWLEANMGKQRTFDAIVKNVFTPCSVPISKYVLQHDNSVLPDSNVPQTLGYAVPLNLSGVGIVQPEAHTIAELLTKELPLARDNGYDLPGDAADLQFRASRGRASKYGTKLLESTLVDYSNFIPYKLEDVLLNMWAYCIAKGTYHGTAYVTHPLTGDRLQFTMLNAFILMVYCYNKGYLNQTPSKIQPVTVRMIPREVSYVPEPGFTVKPTFADLRQRAESAYVTDAQIKNMMGTRNPIYSFSNSTSFYGECYNQWAEMNRQFYLHDNSPWLSRSLYLEGIMRRLYWCGMKMDLPDTGQDYHQWFTLMNLNLDGCSQNDYLNLMTQLFMYGTGYSNNDARDLTSMQATCIQILQKFTSYSTHIISNQGAGAPEFSHDTPTKIDIIELATTDQFFIPQIIPDLKLAFTGVVLAEAGFPPSLSQEDISFTTELAVTVETGTPTSSYIGGHQTVFVPLVNMDNSFIGIANLPPDGGGGGPPPPLGYYEQVAADGAIALWKMNVAYAAGGGQDSIGTNNLTLNSGSSTPASVAALNAVSGGSWKFDGSVNMSPQISSEFYMAGGFAIEYWGEWTDLHDTVFFEVNANNGYSIQLVNGDYGHLGVQENVGGPANNVYTIPNLNLNDGTVHHVVIVVTGFTINDTSAVYINGVNQTQNSTTHAAPDYNNAPVYLGSRAGYLGQGTTGTFSDLAIYPHALTPEQILAHYNAGKLP